VPIFAGLGAVAANYLWFNPPTSTSTLNLRKTLMGVTEVRIRVGCMSGDSGSSKKIVRQLQGKEAQAFIKALEVRYNRYVFNPLSCNYYTFEFYKGKTKVTEIAYFPEKLIWSNWNDGYGDSARELNYKAKQHLQQLLEPYEETRKSMIMSK
jgi:hypothetical protein